jgi:hypothetical protein
MGDSAATGASPGGYASRVVLWLGGCVAIGFLVSIAFFFRFTAEDSYIPARYAENLVETGALVFNSGERINALTSPLHALVEAVLYRLTGATVVSYKILSVFFVALSASVLFRRFRSLPERLIGASIVLLSPPVVLWTVGGLETPLLLLLVTLVCALVFPDGPPTARRLTLAYVLGGLAFTTRFDSVLFTAPLLLHASLRHRRASGVLRSALLGALPPLAWLLFAGAYYGDLFPTSYYVKRPTFTGPVVRENSWYIFQYLVFTGLIPFAAVLAASPGFSSSLRTALPRHLRRVGSLYVGLLLMLAYGLAIATFHMMFAFRFFVPYLPAVLFLLADFLRERTAGSHRVVVPRPVSVALAAFLVFQAIHLTYTYRSSLNGLVQGIGEYRTVGVRQYSDEFMRTLRRSGEDAMAHWDRAGASRARSPRVLTFAGGIFPYTCKGAHTYETLVSYRHNCLIVVGPNWKIYGKREKDPTGAFVPAKAFDLRSSADYIHVMSPRHGSIEDHLPKPIEEYELVSDHEIFFEGQTERVQVYYDPSPSENPLPPRMSGQF